jgi:RNA polymerase sigma factor (sigma-70 family)
VAEAGEESSAGNESSALSDHQLDQFCHREHRRLVGMLGLYCGDADLAEELAQEALVRLCRHWSKLNSEEDAPRWLNRVAFNLAKSSFRTKAARRRILDRYGHTLAAAAAAPGVGARELAVRSAVANLPDRQRQVVILRYFCDLSVAETALVMRCPAGTVKSVTSQAVAGLRRAGLEVSDD